MGNSKYLLGFVWLLVLMGASASNSFQRISASAEREACVTDLVQTRADPNSEATLTMAEWFSIIDDAIICVART
ncbi:MAG TPA: hypothetical protein VKA95_03910 [Nitrososphaeraceae archaeon]|nr:hypothetical protein [Nitrososphaeraceae archaeon]